MLDENFFLYSDKFQQHYDELVDTFKKAPDRNPSHAGLSYPDDPKELEKYLDSLFTQPDAAGIPTQNKNSKKLAAIITPHIDFNRGGFCYTHAYKELAETEPPELVIILGVSHAGSQKPFIASRKNFITPFGSAQADQDFIAELEGEANFDIFADEFSHRSEHSIEFQVVFLQYIMQKYHADKPMPKIVPILCSSFHELYEENTSPMDVPEISIFINALSELIQKSNKKTLIISGVDLSHIGRNFGDDYDLTDDVLTSAKNEDLVLVKFAELRNKEGVFNSITKDMDARKVCGLSSIYTTLALLEKEDIKSVEDYMYAQATDKKNQLMVSFFSMGFYK